MTIEQTTKGFYETLALNVQKGDTLVIRFKNDPTVYVGVPMLRTATPLGICNPVFFSDFTSAVA